MKIFLGTTKMHKICVIEILKTKIRNLTVNHCFSD